MEAAGDMEAAMDLHRQGDAAAENNSNVTRNDNRLQLTSVSMGAAKNKKLFPQKLWDLINDAKYNSCLRWSDDGQLVYLNREEFEDCYLKTSDNQFHTQKAISFVRQMNMYGFRKVDDCFYENDNFKRNCDHLLRNMIRKHPNKGHHHHHHYHCQQQQQPPPTVAHHHHQHNNDPYKSLYRHRTILPMLADDDNSTIQQHTTPPPPTISLLALNAGAPVALGQEPNHLANASFSPTRQHQLFNNRSLLMYELANNSNNNKNSAQMNLPILNQHNEQFEDDDDEEEEDIDGEDSLSSSNDFCCNASSSSISGNIDRNETLANVLSKLQETSQFQHNTRNVCNQDVPFDNKQLSALLAAQFGQPPFYYDAHVHLPPANVDHPQFVLPKQQMASNLKPYASSTNIQNNLNSCSAAAVAPTPVVEPSLNLHSLLNNQQKELIQVLLSQQQQQSQPILKAQENGKCGGRPFKRSVDSLLDNNNNIGCGQQTEAGGANNSNKRLKIDHVDVVDARRNVVVSTNGKDDGDVFKRAINKYAKNLVIQVALLREANVDTLVIAEASKYTEQFVETLLDTAQIISRHSSSNCSTTKQAADKDLRLEAQEKKDLMKPKETERSNINLSDLTSAIKLIPFKILKLLQ